MNIILMNIILVVIPALVIALLAALFIDNLLVYILWHLMAAYILADWWIFLNHE